MTSPTGQQLAAAQPGRKYLMRRRAAKFQLACRKMVGAAKLEVAYSIHVSARAFAQQNTVYTDYSEPAVLQCSSKL